MLLKKSLALILIVTMVFGTISFNFAEPTEDFHIPESTQPGETAKGPEVVEYMEYIDDDKRIEPGSLSGDVNFSNVGKGLFYDGQDFYFFLDTGIMATNFMYTIQGDRFYFGEDGKMIKNSLVSYNNELYYFDINGAMYKNRWYTEEEIDTYDNTVTYTTYYFGPTGRAYRAVDNPIILKTIDGSKYGFNTDGERLEGYYNLDGTKLEDDEDPAYQECMYYFDPQEGGAAYTGWHYYSGSQRGDEYDDNEEIVLYFDEKTCRKVYSKSPDRCVSRTIEGERYMFDENGVRKNKWYTTDPNRPATRSNTKYFNEEYDGYLAKGWFMAIPSKDSISEDNRKRYDNNEEVWYYALSNGSIVKNCVRKIGNYYYAFDEDGVMQEDCLVKSKGSKFVKSYKLENLNRANVLLDPAEYGMATRKSTEDLFSKTGGLLNAAEGERWMYFVGESEEGDRGGAMANLNTPVKLELNDADIYLVASSIGGYTLVADNDDGVKVTNVVKRNKKLLQNGILLKPDPDDNNYGIVRYEVATRTPGEYLDWQNKPGTNDTDRIYQYIVVNSSGGIVGSDPSRYGSRSVGRKCIKDRQGFYIYIDADGEFIGVYNEQGRVVKAKEDVVEGGKVIIKKGQEIWEHKEDKDWVPGLPDKSLLVDCSYMYLNFADKDGEPNGPYANGITPIIYGGLD